MNNEAPHENNGFTRIVQKYADAVKRGFAALGRAIRGALGKTVKAIKRLGLTLGNAVGRKPREINGQVNTAGSITGGSGTDAVLDSQTIVFTKPEQTAAVPPLNKTGKKEAVSVFSTEIKRKRFGVEILSMTMRLLLVTVLILAVSGAGIAVGMVKAYVGMSPELDLQAVNLQAQGSKIYDAKGALITTYSGNENRIYTKIQDIPKQLQNAFIATEDIRFYEHEGVDYKRLFSAVLGNLTNSSAAGGSTITQQLIKNRILSPERTLKRKTQEAYLALALEKELSKEQILEAYLNTINLGSGNYDVASAAKDYFGKSLKQLTLRECACIAGLTQAPNSYDPRKNYYVRKTPEKTDKRTDTVLKRMYEGGYITKKEYSAALKEKLKVVEKSTNSGIYDMPHFVEYAINDVITHFLEQRNLPDTKQNRTDIENEIRVKGYQIYTTVDRDIQTTVEKSLSEWKRYPSLKDPTQKKITYKNSDGSTYTVEQPQAAAVVLDQHTGQIKAIVGSRDVPTQMKTLNRATDGKMPVGSSIKPLTVYGPALDKGLTPSTLINNTNDPIEGWGTGSGRPSNYGGEYSSLTGPTTMRTGLVKSYNVVAARLLMDEVGLNTAYNYLVTLGVNPKHINKTGAGLALGTSGITPLEMAGGFAAIANSGEYLEPISFTVVKDADGKVILDATQMQEHRQVYKESTAYQLVDMLKDAVQNGTGQNAKISGQEVAGKTGTNDKYRGVFFAGITGYYTATVWIGHDNYQPSFRYGTTGGGYAAPLWQNFMSKILSGKSNKKILEGSPEDYGLVKCTVCSETGMLAGKFCPHKTEYFAKDTAPTKTCTKHTGSEFNEQVNNYINSVYALLDKYNVPADVRTVIYQKSEKLVNDIAAAKDKAEMDKLFATYKSEVTALLGQYSSPTPTPTQPPPTTQAPTQTPQPTKTQTPVKTPTPKPSKSPP